MVGWSQIWVWKEVKVGWVEVEVRIGFGKM